MNIREFPNDLGICLDESTIQSIRLFAALVEKWNRKINLVSRSTIEEIWSRHIIDSVQLYRYAPAQARSWADFGSGGGFPGLVLALISRQLSPNATHILVESDQRKAVFLREAIRQTGAPATVLAQRIEAVPLLGADVISARALAPLDDLLGLIQPHLVTTGIAILPKGASGDREVLEARERWQFDLESFPSLTDGAAQILRITALRSRVENLDQP